MSSGDKKKWSGIGNKAMWEEMDASPVSDESTLGRGVI
jgi:hypothetical protein